MKTAIITVAGISSRFNTGVSENKKELKAIYTEEGNPKNTLLYHLLQKCDFADKIVIVGGYKFENLKKYCMGLEKIFLDRIDLIYNEHYEDLASGYSLYLGLQKALCNDVKEILFVEGDLDVDNDSFNRVIDSQKSVLTYNNEPIYANKAVVLYRDDKSHYRYAFNSNHGMLLIGSPFSCILNSGQVWKFTEIDALKKASTAFYNETKDETNLRIIQNYLDEGIEVELIPLKRWTNCNTKSDFRKIVSYWKENR